jgi:hypothetical protein
VIKTRSLLLIVEIATHLENIFRKDNERIMLDTL